MKPEPNKDNFLFYSPTGDQSSELTQIISVNFNRYEIGVEISSSGKFLGIASIKVNKDFTESIKNIGISNVHDVDKYYDED